MSLVDPPLITQIRHLLTAHEELARRAAERDAACQERDRILAQDHQDWLKLRREHDAMQGERDAAREELRRVRVDFTNGMQHRSRLQVELYEAQREAKTLRDGRCTDRDVAEAASVQLMRELDETRTALNQTIQREEAARNAAAGARQLKAENVDLREQLSNLRATLGRLAEGAS